MGRSGGGGGFHSGGGGGFSHRSGGGGFHHSGGGYHHHGGGYHHYGGGGYYSSNSCNICAIPIFIILVVIMVIIILCSSPGVSYSTTLTRCEQYVACPSSLSKGKIDFSVSGSYVTAYLLTKLPSSPEQANTTRLHVSGNTLSSGSYVFNSFNLVKGSTISWDISSSGYTSFHFYLIDGYEEYKKFKNYDTFHYVKSSFSSHAYGSYTATYSDEFFAVIDAEYFVSIQSHDYVVDHTRYDVSKAIDKSSSSHTFKVDDSYVPGACLIAEMPCEAPDSASTDISISYDVDRDIVFWVCLGLAVLFGIGVLAAIAVCIYCTVKKKNGQTGTTYQTVPTSSSQAPSYPASYQQPQDPAAYNPSNPVYATAGGVNPSAVPPAYNPSIGVDPTYGTMPATSAY